MIARNPIRSNGHRGTGNSTKYPEKSVEVGLTDRSGRYYLFCGSAQTTCSMERITDHLIAKSTIGFSD